MNNCGHQLECTSPDWEICAKECQKSGLDCIGHSMSAGKAHHMETCRSPECDCGAFRIYETIEEWKKTGVLKL